MIELAGKTAVVTGAGTGIGAASAMELARAGARVVLISRTSERIAQVAQSIQASGFDAQVLAGDVRLESLMKQLEAEVGQVDILVNNAAVFAPYAPLEEVESSEVEAVFDVDLAAVLRLTRFVLPGMKRRGWGRVINLGSIAGRLGAAGQVAYSTAKAGLEGFTRSVAIETAGHGITCNLIEPGLVQTERTTAMIPSETRAHFVAATPIGREGQAVEVAHAVTYLASEGAAAVTGATLALDGGLSLR